MSSARKILIFVLVSAVGGLLGECADRFLRSAAEAPSLDAPMARVQDNDISFKK